MKSISLSRPGKARTSSPEQTSARPADSGVLHQIDESDAAPSIAGSSPIADLPAPVELPPPDEVPRVNGIALAGPAESPNAEELRQRTCAELLRQAAIAAQLLGADDPAPVGGVASEAASEAIEALLERELPAADPDEASCRRYYEGHSSHFTIGERVHARHVLFAVTPGVDVKALRSRAELCLLDLRVAASEDQRFAKAAAELSNCPSGATGGDLGWLEQADCAPEFARELFGHAEVGVLSRLVHSRFGLHVVEVLAREPGRLPAFEAVRPAVAQALVRQGFATALRQYLQRLADAALIEGVDLDATTGEPVQ